jgi:ABC-type Fe3+/spermidine/putrescine transport system ATPase subunit
MNKGTIEQLGHPDEIYHNPSNAFVANFIGNANIIKPKIISKHNNRFQIKLLGQELELTTSKNQFLCLIRPEEIYPSEKSKMRYKVEWIENLGNILRYTLKNKDSYLSMDILNRISTKKYEVGEEVGISFESTALKVISV